MTKQTALPADKTLLGWQAGLPAEASAKAGMPQAPNAMPLVRHSETPKDRMLLSFGHWDFGIV